MRARYSPPRARCGRERLDRVAAAERVDEVGDAALVATICCVRSAIVAASLVGRPSASS
jgi:hypothetical protein